jgi:hypothetical protein
MDKDQRSWARGTAYLFDDQLSKSQLNDFSFFDVSNWGHEFDVKVIDIEPDRKLTDASSSYFQRVMLMMAEQGLLQMTSSGHWEAVHLANSVDNCLRSALGTTVPVDPVIILFHRVTLRGISVSVETVSEPAVRAVDARELAKRLELHTLARTLQSLGFFRVYVFIEVNPVGTSSVNRSDAERLHSLASCRKDIYDDLRILAKYAGVVITDGSCRESTAPDSGIVEPEYLKYLEKVRREIRSLIATTKQSSHNVRHYCESLDLVRSRCPSPARDGIHREMSEQFKSLGYCVIPPNDDLSKATIELVESLQFTLDVSNRHKRMDWGGNGLRPFLDSMRTAVTQSLHLRSVSAALYSEANFQQLSSIIGYPFTILNCRFYLSTPHGQLGVGPQRFHTDGCPPGVVRAMWYLDDVDSENGPTEFIHPLTQRETSIHCLRGSVLVFDANRLLHRGKPPISRTRRVVDLVLCPELRGLERTVISAGMNSWPVTPFRFSLSGMTVYPPFSSAVYWRDAIVPSRSQL